jgi:hypothetical protein
VHEENRGGEGRIYAHLCKSRTILTACRRADRVPARTPGPSRSAGADAAASLAFPARLHPLPRVPDYPTKNSKGESTKWGLPVPRRGTLQALRRHNDVRKVSRARAPPCRTHPEPRVSINRRSSPPAPPAAACRCPPTRSTTRAATAACIATLREPSARQHTTGGGGELKPSLRGRRHCPRPLEVHMTPKRCTGGRGGSWRALRLCLLFGCI